MLKNERAQEIVNILKAEGFCSVKRLSEMLYTSESSVRRTLSTLEKSGIIKRSYGGAELLNTHTAVAKFGARAQQNAEAKRVIAKKAALLIKDGDVVFLDQSSTAMYLAYELNGFKNLTVITNNLEVMNVLSRSDVTVFGSGGRLTRAGCMGFIGADAENTFKSVYADICFFSAKSLSNDGVITDCYKEEIDVRRAMFSNSQKVAFLCDSSKFDSRSAFLQCSLKDIDYIVTEDEQSTFLNEISNIKSIALK